MKKLFNSVTNVLIWGYAGFGMVMYVCNYFNVDILGILANLNVPPEFLGSTAFIAGGGKTVQVIIRWALSKFETRNAALYGMFLVALENVLKLLAEVKDGEITNSDKTNQAIKLLSTQMNFLMILADKNKQSVILDDDVKAQIEAWQEEVKQQMKGLILS